MLKAVKKTRVYEDIVTQLKDLIAQGRLKSGDQLPSERELSDTFKVSRASVREALRALESVGLLESRQGEGTYVARSVESLFQPLAAAIYQQKDELLQTFETRKLIEPQIASLAAQRATPEEVAEFEAILKVQADDIGGGGSGVEADTRFHLALARATKNRVVLRLIETFVDWLKESRELSLQVEGRPSKSLAGHRQILAAIRSRSPERARKAMLSHLEAIEKNVLRLLHRDRSPRARSGDRGPGDHRSPSG